MVTRTKPKLGYRTGGEVQPVTLSPETRRLIVELSGRNPNKVVDLSFILDRIVTRAELWAGTYWALEKADRESGPLRFCHVVAACDWLLKTRGADDDGVRLEIVRRIRLVDDMTREAIDRALRMMGADPEMLDPHSGLPVDLHGAPSLADLRLAIETVRSNHATTPDGRKIDSRRGRENAALRYVVGAVCSIYWELSPPEEEDDATIRREEAARFVGLVLDDLGLPYADDSPLWQLIPEPVRPPL